MSYKINQEDNHSNDYQDPVLSSWLKEHTDRNNELATLRAENERLKTAISNTKLRDAECKTLEGWRQAAMYYESNWSSCSYSFNRVAGKLKEEITERTRQLDEYKQDALRWLFYASSPQTALSLGTKLDPLTEQDWKAECDRLADAIIKGASHDNA